MSKNAIIGIVVGVAVLIVIIVGASLITTDAPIEEPVVEEPLTDPIIDEPATDPIMELTEEEIISLQEIFIQAVPEDTPMDDLQELEEKLMQLSIDELRELTVEDVEAMLAEIQE